VHKGALRYVADTIAIESLASDFPIHKEAGLFEDLGFSGVASTITDAVKSLMPDDASPGGWVKAIGDLLVSGALFKLHPLLGIVYAVARHLGVDVIGIGKKILSGVYSAVKSGAQVALSDIDYHGKIAVAMYNKSLIKEAQLFGKRKDIDIPFLPRKGGSKIERVFGNLFRAGRRGKLKTLVVAIVIWTLKTAILGAGILGGAALVTNLIKGKSKDKTEQVAQKKKEESIEEQIKHTPAQDEEFEPDSEISLRSIFQKTKSGPKANGRGTREFKNDQSPGGFIWKVPIHDTIQNTLAAWAKDIYKDLIGHDDAIYKTPSFMSMVKRFQNNYISGESSVMVPAGFKTRKSVVDTFAKDVPKE